MSGPALAALRERMRVGDWPSVIAEVDAAPDYQPTAEEQALIALARALSRGGTASQAEWEAVAGQVPDNPQWASDLGLLALLAGQRERAQALLAWAVAQPGADSLVFARAGAVRLRSEDVAGAEAAYREAVRLEPHRAEWHHNLASTLTRQDRMAEALASLDRALELDPELEKAAVHRTRLLQAGTGDVDETVTALEQRLRAEPQNCALRLQLARALEAADRSARALYFLVHGIRYKPSDPDYWYHLARLFQGQRHRDRALGAIKEALKQAPERAPYWELMARVQRERKGPETALDVLGRAEARTGPQPGYGQLRAELLREWGDHAEAEKVLAELIERFPGHAGLRVSLGLTQLQIGRIPEATEAFRKAAALNPRSLAHLARVRALPTDPDTLAMVEELAAYPLLDEDVRAGLAFALAHGREQQGDSDAAFEALNRGNALARSRTDYDREAHDQFVQRLMEAFPAQRFADAPAGDPSERPVFVCGLPRSGTTLTEQVLASHPEVFGAGELNALPRIAAHLPRRLGEGAAPYPECVGELTAEAVAGAAGAYLEELDARDTEAARVVDKLPHNFLHLGLIALLFPHARIVHLRRDPRDVAVSTYWQNFGSRNGLLGYAFDLSEIGHHINAHHRLMRHWHEVLPMPIFELDYEALVSHPEPTVRNLLTFLGLDWDDRVLGFFNTEREVRTASVYQVRQPIYDTSVSRWRRYETHLEPLLTALDPEVVAPYDESVPDEPGIFPAGGEDMPQGTGAQPSE